MGSMGMLEMRTVMIALVATFLGGMSVGLLISYPIPEETFYVGFWALLIGLWSCVLGGWAMIEHAVVRERVRVDKVARAVGDRLLVERGLRSVDEP